MSMKEELVLATTPDDVPTEDIVKVFDIAEYEIAQHTNNPYCPDILKNSFKHQYDLKLKQRVNNIVDGHYPDCDKKTILK